MRLTSPYEHERAAAALLASAFLAKHGLTWSHLVSWTEPLRGKSGGSADPLRTRHHGGGKADGYRGKRDGCLGQALDVVA